MFVRAVSVCEHPHIASRVVVARVCVCACMCVYEAEVVENYVALCGGTESWIGWRIFARGKHPQINGVISFPSLQLLGKQSRTYVLPHVILSTQTAHRVDSSTRQTHTRGPGDDGNQNNLATINNTREFSDAVRSVLRVKNVFFSGSISTNIYEIDKQNKKKR